MGKAICKELGKTSAIVLAGRNLAKLETEKRSWTSLVWRAIFAKLTLQIAHRCRHWQTMLHRWAA